MFEAECQSYASFASEEMCSKEVHDGLKKKGTKHIASTVTSLEINPDPRETSVGWGR